jgi:dephospho-CoA kinase
MLRVVGLSGGIGSGKSTVAATFTELGACVVDADAIVHDLQAAGSPVLDELSDEFGPEIIAADGSLDRAALGDIVFRDPDARKRLGAIMHPKVGAEMMRQLAAGRDSGAALVVLDVPLLFEGIRAGTGISTQLDLHSTIAVHVPPAMQLERQIARDGCTREEAQRRIDSQLPIDEKKQLADFVIDNAGTREETRDQVERLFARLTAEAPAANAVEP